MKVKEQSGFSLLEALLSVALFAIGFAGIYSFVVSTNNDFQRSYNRESATQISNGILEYLIANKKSLNSYTLDLRYCSSINTSSRIFNPLLTTQLNTIRNWCYRMEKELGPAASTTKRILSVSQMISGGNTYFVASVLITDEKEKNSVVTKRVFRK